MCNRYLTKWWNEITFPWPMTWICIRLDPNTRGSRWSKAVPVADLFTEWKWNWKLDEIIWSRNLHRTRSSKSAALSDKVSDLTAVDRVEDLKVCVATRMLPRTPMINTMQQKQTAGIRMMSGIALNASSMFKVSLNEDIQSYMADSWNNSASS